MKTISITCGNPFGSYKMSCAVWGKDTGGIPLVCGHDLTGSGKFFRLLAMQLCNDRRIYCPDLVGRGNSEWLKKEWVEANPKLYSIDYYLDDMERLLDHIEAPLVDWVGTSMGGIMGMIFAKRGRVRRLVLNDIGYFVTLDSMLPIREIIVNTPVFANIYSAESFMRKTLTTLGPITDEEWWVVAKAATQQVPDGKGLRFAYDPAIAHHFLSINHDLDFGELYDSLDCPVLLMRGEHSTMLNRKIAKDMTRRGPKAKLVTFSNSGHPVTLMRRKHIRAVRIFLSNG